MMIKRICIIAAALLLGLAIEPGGAEGAQDAQNRYIVATCAPVARLARKIAGQRVEVKVLIPQGADAHSYSMKPDDYRVASRAMFIVMNGADLEVTMQKGLRQLGEMLDTSEGLDLIAFSEHIKNPHVWLDPSMLKAQAGKIRDRLIKADPGGREYYEENHRALLVELDEMDAYAKNALKPLGGRPLVTHHDAFAYFARRYGLGYMALSGSHHGRPLPGKLAEVYALVREQKVPAVFADTIYYQDAFVRLSSDLGVRLCVLDTLVGGTDFGEFAAAFRRNVDTMAECLGSPVPADVR